MAHADQELMSSPKIGVRKALTLSLAQTWISLGLSIATVVIVSRLLTPAEVGVFSVAVGLIALVQMLRDFGVSEFLVQETELTDAKIRTAFTVSLVIAWSLAALLFGCSGLVGDFYHEPGAARVTRVISLVFVLLPFGTTSMALLTRNMRFDHILKIRIAETVARGATTIGLAFAGFTYMSMAWAGVAGMSVLVLGSAWWGSEYRVWGLGLSHWRRVVHFGVVRTVADVAAQAGEQSANIVVGRMLGMAAAGFYSRGFGLVNLFRTNVLGAFGTVALSAFSKEHRERDAAPELYRRSLVHLTAISWPFLAFAILMAFPIMRIAFGSQWDSAVPLMRWLCAAAMLGTLVYYAGRLLIAVGAYRDTTRIDTTFQLARIGLVILAAFHGLEAVAASQVLAYMLAVLLYYHRLARFQVLRPRAMLATLAPSVWVAVAANVVPVAVLLWWPGSVRAHVLPAFCVAAVGAAGGWLLGLRLTRHPLCAELWQMISKLTARFAGRWHRG